MQNINSTTARANENRENTTANEQKMAWHATAEYTTTPELLNHSFMQTIIGNAEVRGMATKIFNPSAPVVVITAEDETAIDEIGICAPATLDKAIVEAHAQFPQKTICYYAENDENYPQTTAFICDRIASFWSRYIENRMGRDEYDNVAFFSSFGFLLMDRYVIA